MTLQVIKVIAGSFVVADVVVGAGQFESCAGKSRLLRQNALQGENGEVRVPRLDGGSPQQVIVVCVAGQLHFVRREQVIGFLHLVLQHELSAIDQ